MIRSRGLDAWLPTYLAQTLQRLRLRRWRSRNLTHVIFLICDHFEPAHAVKDPGQAVARLAAWRRDYRSMQEACAARNGLKPLHTWFYPPHHGFEHLPWLAQMAFDGMGEVELHYHHDGDTEATLRVALLDTLRQYHRAGLLLQIGDPPGRRFGFIHGDWALANSRDGRFCGVNGEIGVLQDLGCWGDLTMPSGEMCQTRKINSIYYAIDNPARPKSHDWGRDAVVGEPDRRGLMLIQGPLSLNFHAPGHPRIENAGLTTANWGRPDRIRAWLDCHVHVLGRPEWLFVKLHAHGAIERDFSALFGERAGDMHRELAEKYNDGRRFRLHYVTARQAYNLARAAEHGECGNPGDHLDHEIPPPVTTRYCVNANHEARRVDDQRIDISAIAPAAEATQLRLRLGWLVSLAGSLERVSWDSGEATLRIGLHGPAKELEIRGIPPRSLTSIDGAEVAVAEGDRIVAHPRASTVTLRM